MHMTYETQKRDVEGAFNGAENAEKKTVGVQNKEEAFTMASILFMLFKARYQPSMNLLLGEKPVYLESLSMYSF